MKIGIISDIHSNLPALKAVMAELENQGCEKILCCGDIIGIGPFPEETVAYVRSLPDFLAVAGNHDRYFTEGLPTAFPNDEDMSEGEGEHHRWEHGLLSPESEDYLRSLPLKLELELCGRKISIQHYGLDEKSKFRDFPPELSCNELENLFPGNFADIILFGHDHRPFYAQHKGRHYLDPGSLGCPAAEKNIARAVVMDISEDTLNFSSIRIQYDVQETLGAIDRIAYPEHENIKKFFYGVTEP